MVKQKWLMIVGIIIILILPLSSIAATPVQADSNPWTTVQRQPGHFGPPIHFGQVATPIRPDRQGSGPSGTTAVVYPPLTIQNAYSFVSTANGTGKTIAIIDAFGDPTLNNDVSTFDSKFNLSQASVNVYYPDGQPVITRANNSDAAGWAVETALDVEWAHANAPGATIDLVVAYDDTFQHLLNAIEYASGQYVSKYQPTSLSSLPVVISMSFGAPEDEFTATSAKSTLGPWEAAFTNAFKENIILIAASGDGGAKEGTGQLTVDYPAASQYVIGVGGTTLTTAGNNYGSEKAWVDSGGGYGATSLSTVLGSEPSYQVNASIPDSAKMRGVPDVAFDADPNTGVYVYQNGWWDVGGTSVGAPNWASIVADAAAANSGITLNLANLYGTVYASSSDYQKDIHDIISGSNGYYTAVTGWDAVTGIGTPIVSGLLTTTK
jgi:subtilase family serine protease